MKVIRVLCYINEYNNSAFGEPNVPLGKAAKMGII